MANSMFKVLLGCPIEKVWDKITNLPDFLRSSDFQDIKIIDDHHIAGVSKDGVKTHIEITDSKKHKRWALKIENEMMVGTLVGKFYDHGDKTTVSFTHDIISKKLRFKPFLKSYIRVQQKLYLYNLKRELNGEEASVIQKS